MFMSLCALHSGIIICHTKKKSLLLRVDNCGVGYLPSSLPPIKDEWLLFQLWWLMLRVLGWRRGTILPFVTLSKEAKTTKKKTREKPLASLSKVILTCLWSTLFWTYFVLLFFQRGGLMCFLYPEDIYLHLKIRTCHWKFISKLVQKTSSLLPFSL